jgi:hypothetical protein
LSGVPSTVIRRFAYDPAQRTLDVSFVTGRRYRYLAVPPDVAEGFRGAFVKGRYFNSRIRDRFACEELEEDADWGA